jgi:hypothetical protein
MGKQVDVRDFDVDSNQKWGDGHMRIRVDSVSAKLFIEKETNN